MIEKLKHFFEAKNSTEAENNRMQLNLIKMLIGLFVLLALLTVFSRITQALTIPAVKTGNVYSTSLIYNITGEGILESGINRYIDLPVGVRVSTIYSNIGSYVKKDDKILALDTNDIGELIAENNKVLRKIEISMEVERLSTDSPEVVKLKNESLQMDYDELNSYNDKLKELQDNQGIIYSETKGRINNINASVGDVISKESQIVIGIADYALHASITGEHGKYLEVGDQLAVTRLGKNDDFKATITRIVDKGDNMMELAAKMPDDQEYSAGVLVFTAQKITRSYPYSIPLSAIREDIDGTFLYILEEVDSLLGKEYHAKRVDIQIQEKDATQAIIKESELTYGDSIIIRSNKIIHDGDKVKIED